MLHNNHPKMAQQYKTLSSIVDQNQGLDNHNENGGK